MTGRIVILIIFFCFPKLTVPTFDPSRSFPQSSTETPPVIQSSSVSVAGPSASSAATPIEDFRYFYKSCH